MDQLNGILNQFESISLNEMEDVELMDRIDTKFAFNKELLPQVLEKLNADYFILEIENERLSQYKTLYFDNDDFQFYKDHHNSKDRRFKVRYRSYISSDTHFLEIKEKRKGRTNKTRIPVEKIKKELQNEHIEFLSEFIKNPKDLEAKLWNQYKRITFVSKNKKERLTLDLDLNYEWKGEKSSFDSLVIAELKQKRLNRSASFFKVMKEMNIRPYRLSKYCLGTLKIHGKSRLKYNRFKNKILTIKRITNDI